MKVLMLLAAAAATQPDDKFNLVCTGTLSSKSFYSGEKSEPYRYLYRLDLGRKKWCEADCTAIHDIHDVQPGALYLEAPVDVNTSTEKKFSSGYINRQNGHQSILMTSGRSTDILILKWEGECEKQPFQGFPAVETKF